MTYERVEDVPPDDLAEMIDGVLLLARKLREWRDYGALHELRATWLNADGPMYIICHHDDRVTFVDGTTVVDLTEMLDGVES